MPTNHTSPDPSTSPVPATWIGLHAFLKGRTSVRASEVGAAMWGCEEAAVTRGDAMRIASKMRDVGWEHYRSGVGGKRAWAYRPATRIPAW